MQLLPLTDVEISKDRGPQQKKVKYIEIYYKGLGDVFVLFLKYLLNLPNGIAVFSQVHR